MKFKLSFWAVMWGMISLCPFKSLADPKGNAVPGGGIIYSEENYRIHEPISAQALNHLAQALPQLDSAHQIQAAILLYRYHIDAGKQPLLKAARVGDFRASTILVLNHEKDALEPTLKTLLLAAQSIKKGEGDSYIPWYLILALGQWEDDRVKQALLKAYGDDPDDSWFALALAQLNVKEALPAMFRALSRADEQEELEGDKFMVGASIIKLGGKGSAALLREYLHLLKSDTTAPNTKYAVATALFYSDDDRALEAFNYLADKYISGKKFDRVSLEHQWGQPLYKQQTALGTFIDSARYLAKRGSRKSPQILKALVDGGFEESSQLLAEEILRHDPNSAALIQIMGEAWVKQAKMRLSLRVVPYDFLPVDKPVFSALNGLK